MAASDRRPGIRPQATLGRQLDNAARYAFPASSTALLMLFSRAPFGIEEQAALLPAVTLAAVWFWSLFRPAAVPPPILFLVGLLFDLLGYMPMGVGVLIVLLVYGLALRWRPFLARQSFFAIWLAFSAVAVTMAVLGWILTMLLSVRFIPGAPAIFQAAVSAALYPALTVLFAHAHRSVADPEDA